MADAMCCGVEGKAKPEPGLPQIGDAGCWPWVGDLTVKLPGCVAFEAAHDFLFAFAFGAAFGNVVLHPLA